MRLDQIVLMVFTAVGFVFGLLVGGVIGFFGGG
jgi:hypothetical protein